jgi:hypothetical protein
MFPVPRADAEVHALKSRIQTAVIVAVIPAIERANGVDSDAPEIVRARLKERQRFGRELDVMQEIIGVARL